MEYLLKRKKGQKSLRMHFSDDGQLIVSAPYEVSKEEIDKFLSKNLQWIKEHQVKIPVHNYEENEKFYYLGKEYSLKIIKGQKDNIECVDDKLVVTTGYTETKNGIRRMMFYFYYYSLVSIIYPMFKKWTAVLGIPMPELTVSDAKTSWGVCYPKKKHVRISLMTVLLEEDLIEMICVHELCHFFYCNHSKQFWDKVESCIPDVNEKEKRLKAIAKSGIARNFF